MPPRCAITRRRCRRRCYFSSRLRHCFSHFLMMSAAFYVFFTPDSSRRFSPSFDAAMPPLFSLILMPAPPMLRR